MTSVKSAKKSLGVPDPSPSRTECGAEPTADQRGRVALAGAPQYFRTVEQVHAQIYEFADHHPELCKVEDIGDSYDKTANAGGADILALRLTSPKGPANKPRPLFIFGTHAREIANPEFAMQFADWLIHSYGKDPEATYLLDNYEICLIPILNPDGHKQIELGYAGKGGDIWWRKNHRPPDGTDLNRNYRYKWRNGGSSSSPNSDTYHGTGPASEPEVAAAQEFAIRIKATMVLDIHSHGDVILVPMGYTPEKQKDDAGLFAIARRFRARTKDKYEVKRSYDLYPNSGSSKDFGYGELGVPAYTIETGPQFHQTDAEMATTWGYVKPVLAYAPTLGTDPLVRAQAPEASAVVVDPATNQVTAQVSAEKTGAPIARVEAFTDPATKEGEGIPLSPMDGKFDSTSEKVTGTLPAPAGSEPVLAHVRAQDAQGRWGVVSVAWLRPPAES